MSSSENGSADMIACVRGGREVFAGLNFSVGSGEALPRMRAQHGDATYFPLVIPKATYGTAEDVTVVGVANILVVSEKMDEQLAYDITRLMFEKQAELISIHPQAKDLSLATAVTGSPVPFHPGAIKYYTEKGAWKP